MDEEQLDKVKDFYHALGQLFQEFSKENDTQLNVQLVVTALGYCMECLYYGAEEQHQHQVTSMILAMMTPAKEFAIERKNESSLD